MSKRVFTGNRSKTKRTVGKVRHYDGDNRVFVGKVNRCADNTTHKSSHYVISGPLICRIYLYFFIVKN